MKLVLIFTYPFQCQWNFRIFCFFPLFFFSSVPSILSFFFLYFLFLFPILSNINTNISVSISWYTHVSGIVDSSGMQMSQCIYCKIELFSNKLYAFTLLPTEYERFWMKIPVFCIFSKLGCAFFKFFFFCQCWKHNYISLWFYFLYSCSQMRVIIFSNTWRPFILLKECQDFCPFFFYLSLSYYRNSLSFKIIFHIYIAKVSQFVAFLFSVPFL